MSTIPWHLLHIIHIHNEYMYYVYVMSILIFHYLFFSWQTFLVDVVSTLQNNALVRVIGMMGFWLELSLVDGMYGSWVCLIYIWMRIIFAYCIYSCSLCILALFIADLLIRSLPNRASLRVPTGSPLPADQSNPFWSMFWFCILVYALFLALRCCLILSLLRRTFYKCALYAHILCMICVFYA